MTSSNGHIFRVTGPLCGEFTGDRWIPAQRPVTRSCDASFDLRLNKQLSKQSWGWWFETPSPHSLWRHRNDKASFYRFRNTPFGKKKLFGSVASKNEFRTLVIRRIYIKISHHYSASVVTEKSNFCSLVYYFVMGNQFQASNFRDEIIFLKAHCIHYLKDH